MRRFWSLSNLSQQEARSRSGSELISSPSAQPLRLIRSTVALSRRQRRALRRWLNGLHLIPLRSSGRELRNGFLKILGERSIVTDYSPRGIRRTTSFGPQGQMESMGMRMTFRPWSNPMILGTGSEVGLSALDPWLDRSQSGAVPTRCLIFPIAQAACSEIRGSSSAAA